MTSERLIKLRLKAKLTQEQLAEKLQINRAMAGRWETTGSISKVYQRILTEFFNNLK
jgi:transcriptional regulator with XRE-family HTH domain